MRVCLVLLIALFVALPVIVAAQNFEESGTSRAQQSLLPSSDAESSPVPESRAALLPVPTQKPEVIVSREACTKIIKHEPAVGVAYQPGIDVRGNAVVPATLGAELGEEADVVNSQALQKNQFVINIDGFIGDALVVGPETASLPNTRFLSLDYNTETGEILMNGAPFVKANLTDIRTLCLEEFEALQLQQSD